jgi:hypothetical protein
MSKYGHPGILHPRARLTEDDVCSIRRFVLAQGSGVCEVARWFEVTHQHVSDICREKRWRHITKPPGRA